MEKALSILNKPSLKTQGTDKKALDDMVAGILKKRPQDAKLNKGVILTAGYGQFC